MNLSIFKDSESDFIYLYTKVFSVENFFNLAYKLLRKVNIEIDNIMRGIIIWIHVKLMLYT